MELAPGPIDRLEATALRPFPIAPSFEGLVASAREGVAGVDAALGRAKLDAAGDGVPDLDAAFASTVGVATDVVGGTAGVEDDQVAGLLVDRTAGPEAYRQEVLPVVPQPDVPIEGGFIDPPPPPSTDPEHPHPPDDRHA
jgi:hypothetical protein